MSNGKNNYLKCKIEVGQVQTHAAHTLRHAPTLLPNRKFSLFFFLTTKPTQRDAERETLETWSLVPTAGSAESGSPSASIRFALPGTGGCVCANGERWITILATGERILRVMACSGVKQNHHTPHLLAAPPSRLRIYFRLCSQRRSSFGAYHENGMLGLRREPGWRDRA